MRTSISFPRPVRWSLMTITVAASVGFTYIIVNCTLPIRAYQTVF